MKSLMSLWKELSIELGARCHTSTTLDLKKVEGRVKNEGLSFLTITLPQFGKDFERSLETGWVDRQAFQGFSWRAGLPKFLSGFLCRIFDPISGRLIDEPCIDSIHAVRQLTLVFGKIFMLTTHEREAEAMRGYIDVDQEVLVHEARLASDVELRQQFASTAYRVFRTVLSPIESSLVYGRGWSYDRIGELVPLHGPGATADGLKGNQKWKLSTWTVRLNEVFPMENFLVPNYNYVDKLERVDLLSPDQELPVRVVSVPKTQKTPRIIAIEPTVMMFMQKALQSVIYEGVERDYLLKHLIGFRSQEPNQLLAKEGSLSGDLATLDLSEASDRVSCLHVADLLRNFPELLRAVMAVRSTKADVDGHGIIPLAKYASMGSALTFPIEAMVFLTIVIMGIEHERGRPLSHRGLLDLVGKVRIFGDDIIVPKDCVETVIDYLEAFGLKVNRNKSFWNGKFRESCGKEYYDGVDVSIVRVRRLPPTSLSDAQEIISWVQMSNHFFRSGLWRTTKMLDSFMSGILKDYPVVDETSPMLGRYSFCGYETHRIGGRYQSPLVKGFRTRSVIPRNSLDDHFALLKWFSLRGDLPIADEDNLERSGRPLVVDIKRGWGSPY